MRGSVTLANWAADAKFHFANCSEIAPNARCETGFWGFWEESKPKIMSGVKKGMEEHPGYGVVVTGHSLGGAAAVFAAAILRKDYKDVTMYTYGQPRAGNKALSEAVTAQGQNYRVTHTSDIVPKLPPESPNGEGYLHISPEYWISDGL